MLTYPRSFNKATRNTCKAQSRNEERLNSPWLVLFLAGEQAAGDKEIQSRGIRSAVQVGQNVQYYNVEVMNQMLDAVDGFHSVTPAAPAVLVEVSNADVNQGGSLLWRSRCEATGALHRTEVGRSRQGRRRGGGRESREPQKKGRAVSPAQTVSCSALYISSSEVVVLRFMSGRRVEQTDRIDFMGSNLNESNRIFKNLLIGGKILTFLSLSLLNELRTFLIVCGFLQLICKKVAKNAQFRLKKLHLW